MNKLKTIMIAAAAGFSLAVGSAQAFVITGQLTGDGRADNPDLLKVDVSITVADTTKNIADWVIDVDTTNHGDIKLHEFYFNLIDPFNGTASPWTVETTPPAPSNSGTTDFYFTNFNPSDWIISSPASTVGGGTFSPNFLFEYSGPNVNNLTSLSFRMVSNIGDFEANDFLNAPMSTSTDVALGSGQMGAHLQSLTVNNTTCPPSGNCGDSGFALGIYDDVRDPQSIPEPNVLLLIGAGLLGLMYAASRRRPRMY